MGIILRIILILLLAVPAWAARLFDDATPDYLTVDAASVSANPMTLCAWFRWDDTTNNGTIGWIGDKDNTFRFNTLYISGGSASDPIRAVAANTSLTSDPQITGTPTNSWAFGCGRWLSDIDRWVTLTTTHTQGTSDSGADMSLIDRMAIGVRDDSSASNWFSGDICWVALWDVALADRELEAMSRGANPRRVDPLNLVGFWPVWGDHSPEIDLSVNRAGMTVGGTPSKSAVSCPTVPLFMN